MARTASFGSKTRFALLDHLQLRAILRFGRAILPSAGRGRRPIRRIGIRIALRENHALARLTGVYAQNCPYRHLHGEADAAEASLETDEIITQFEHLGRGETHIEDDLAVFDILAGYGHALGGRVHYDVRGFSAVGDPLVQGTE
jgi:hypothetical protein